MIDERQLKIEIYSKIVAISEGKLSEVDDETILLGDGGGLDSMQLVELCLALEDKASDLGGDFDWTSAVAMSRSRSMFRTAGTLAAEFCKQMEE